MIIPIRCFTCGKPLGSEYDQFKLRVGKGEQAAKVLNELKVERYCCRRMLISQVDLIDEIAEFTI